MIEPIKLRINESIDVKKGLLENQTILDTIDALAHAITDCLRNGGKLALCGNGGSTSDALHFAGEIVGRFQKERKAWPAIVFNVDVATMTAIANDYGYDNVFTRQVEGHLTKKDILIGISTSGNSENVLRAIQMAKNLGCRTAALLGKDGGKIGKVVDYPVIVPCHVTARVQESHIMIIHILCEMIEASMVDE